jgi:hypothetical protein
VKYPHVPEHHQALLLKWEEILREEEDPFHNCSVCGTDLRSLGSRGPRKTYCSARCRKAASRAADDLTVSDWVPQLTDQELLDNADMDGAKYIDAFPGDHPPLNYPVVPRESEPRSEFGWAYEIIGQSD